MFGLTSFRGIPHRFETDSTAFKDHVCQVTMIRRAVMSYLLSPSAEQCWPRYSRAPCFLGCRQATQAQPRRRVGSLCVCLCVSSPLPPRRNIINPEWFSALPFRSTDSLPRSFTSIVEPTMAKPKLMHINETCWRSLVTTSSVPLVPRLCYGPSLAHECLKYYADIR